MVVPRMMSLALLLECLTGLSAALIVIILQ